MLRRFAAGSVVASIAIGIAAAAALTITQMNTQRLSLILAVWCFVPCVWGIWAMLPPAAWVPQRYPVWGAMLGVIAGFMAAFVLDVPFRFLGVTLATSTRVFGVVMATLVYYLMWTVVRMVYRNLSGTSSQ